ncbi:MAG: polysaccharide biosynthesis/export family protein [Candidatus Promineifilaceae bacterium]|nr:polysaccharide biosynthesis/export family protein [Candidatus Promineifilaceae bacterium]
MKNFVSHQWRLKLAALFALLALGLVHADITGAQSYEYRLGPGDKLQVNIFGRPDLSGIYTIRDSGSLSLPIAGEIKASDLTLNQLETEIENQYSVLMKSETGPDLGFDVNIEIVERRPFYIMGDVSRPGSYEYQGRLTVLRAIAIAGGYASSGTNARVIETRSRESLNVHRNNYIAAIAREARLIAERDELDKIAFPSGLLKMQDDPFVAEVLDSERHLFTVRRESFARATRTREEVDEAVSEARKAVSDGLVAKFDLMRYVVVQAGVERQTWELEVASELERVRLEIDETLLHLRAEADRLAILQVKTSAHSDSAEEKEQAKVRITRETDRGMVSIDATDNTAVLPGDVISVPYQEGEAFLSLPDRVQN